MSSRNSSPYRLDPPLGVSPQSRGGQDSWFIASSKPKRVMYRILNGAFAGCAALLPNHFQIWQISYAMVFRMKPMLVPRSILSLGNNISRLFPGFL
jgi:hypothetical protein